MQIYHYDPVSKKYTGTSDAKKDPLEFSVNNKVVYLMPNCSTQAQPPETTSDQDAFFINGAWQIFERPQEPDDPEPTLEELKNTICNKITDIKRKDEYDCLLNLRSKRLSKGSIQDQIESLKIERKL